MRLYSLLVLPLLVILLLPVSSVQVKQDSPLFYTYPLDPILVIGSEGSDIMQFNEPDSVYVDADGNLYAGDTTNFRVQVFDENGTYLYAMGGFSNTTISSGNEVQGIAELSNGTIVVIEKAANLYFFNKGETQPYASVALPAPSSSETTRDTQGIAVDTRNDTIFISDQPNNKVLVLDKNGNYLREFSTGQFSTPENMVVDKAKDIIYISLEGLRRIGMFGINGTLLQMFGLDYATFNYEGLALDAAGNLIAVDEGPDEITNKYSRIILFNGSTLEPFAAFGSYAGSTTGRFHSPDGVAFDFKNERIYVADQGNSRIQGFDYNSPVMIAPPTVTSITTDELDSGKFKFYIGGSLFGGTFSLFFNEESVMNGTFKYGEPIIPSLTGLGVGTYNFTLIATDVNNNTAIGIAQLEITQAPTSSTSTTTTNTSTATTTTTTTTEDTTQVSSSENGGTPIPLIPSLIALGVLITMVYLRGYKKR